MSHIMLLEKQMRKPKPEKEHPMEQRQNLLKEAKDLKYSQFQSIYELWCAYFSSLIGDITPDERMIKADYHGCLLIVSDSPCRNLIGRVGIVIHETRRTFQIITKQDRVLTLPKAGASFQFALDGRVFTLFGDAVLQRSFLRGKRLRSRNTVPHLLR
ncbi:hypothetical protein QR680_009554 [Steinernema hermaphroditum]|uniref:Ribonuclease P protein subunit p29 n=1 Tax=Steinernema hermaphroditum TaxID=289476 RepID=A0AA39IN74_9BILA|nr:hypothetical protein QR680_009554 [Steinernema hermaphroditum]